MWMTSNLVQKNNLDPMLKLLNKEVDLEEHLSWITYTWAALNDSAS